MEQFKNKFEDYIRRLRLSFNDKNLLMKGTWLKIKEPIKNEQ